MASPKAGPSRLAQVPLYPTRPSNLDQFGGQVKTGLGSQASVFAVPKLSLNRSIHAAPTAAALNLRRTSLACHGLHRSLFAVFEATAHLMRGLFLRWDRTNIAPLRSGSHLS